MSELTIQMVSVKHLPKCDRCWHHDAEAGEHPFWPSYTLCPRCVQVLLDIKWPPFIKVGENDYEVCKDEAEWHMRMKQSHPWVNNELQS